MAGERRQATGAEHRREREQHRQAGCHERSEGDQQHREGDRQRQLLGAGESGADGLAHFPFPACLAELLDLEARRRALQRGDRREHRQDVFGGIFGGPLQFELHERRVIVLRQLPGVARRQRRAQFRDLRQGAEPCHHRRQLPPVGGVRAAQGAALHEHVLARVFAEAGPFQDRLGARRLAGGLFPVGELHGPHGVAHRDRHHDQGEPSKGGGLPMCGTPATCSGGDVHGGSLSIACDPSPASSGSTSPPMRPPGRRGWG